jgi:hypothetical protein
MSNALHAFDLRNPESYNEFKQGVRARIDVTMGDIYQRPLLDLITPPCDKINFWAYGQRMVDSAAVPAIYPYTINWRLIFGTQKGIDYGAALAVNGATVLISGQDIRQGLIFQVSGMLCDRWIIHAELPAPPPGTVFPPIEFILDGLYGNCGGPAGLAVTTGDLIG